MQNLFDTIEKCDKHFNEKTFGEVSRETLPHDSDNETVVDVDVDSATDNDDTDIIETNNNDSIGGKENDSESSL